MRRETLLCIWSDIFLFSLFLRSTWYLYTQWSHSFPLLYNRIAYELLQHVWPESATPLATITANYTMNVLLNTTRRDVSDAT